MSAHDVDAQTYLHVILFISRPPLLWDQIMSLEQLAVAKDRKDKLLSRVHKKRIELDFRDRSPHSDNAIHCCRHCAGLFSEKVGFALPPPPPWFAPTDIDVKQPQISFVLCSARGSI